MLNTLESEKKWKKINNKQTTFMQFLTYSVVQSNANMISKKLVDWWADRKQIDKLTICKKVYLIISTK